MPDATSVWLQLLNAAVLLLVVTYAATVALVVAAFLRRRPFTPGSRAQLEWHLLVPCLNEEAVVEQTVRRLAEDFPEAHVWCIDDASVDDTSGILARLAAELPQLHVVTRVPPDAQRGKGPALNAGWRALADGLGPDTDAAGVVVGVIDADGRLDPACLDTIAGPNGFGDPEVGGLQVKVRVVNRQPDAQRRLSGDLLVRLQDAEFTCVIAAQQSLRRRLGTAGLGGNGQFTRLAALNGIAARTGAPWGRSLIEDFELGVHVLLGGHRIEYCHDTWVEQEGLPRLKALIRQRARWGQGNMQCLRYMLPILRSPHVSTPGAVEILYFLTLPWLLVGGSLLFAVSLAVALVGALQGGPGPVAPVVLAVAAAPMVVWGPLYRATTDPGMGHLRSLAFGVAQWPYALVAFAAAWRAFLRLAASRRDWAKTERLAVAGTGEAGAPAS